MKNKQWLISIALVLVIVLSVALAACVETEDPVWSVSFDLNYDGATEIAPLEVKSAAEIVLPADPTRVGFTFEGWFTDEALTTPFVLEGLELSADITLYAKWEEEVPPVCTEHVDSNVDGKCDNCGADVGIDEPDCTEHVDADTDGKCDKCGETVAPPAPVLESISVVYTGANLQVGGSLNASDVVVKAIYSDNSQKTVTDFTLGAIDTATVGTKTVEVTYQGKSATFTVVVEEAYVPCEHEDLDMDGLCDLCGETVGNPQPVATYVLKGVDGDWSEGLGLYLNTSASNGAVEYMIQGVEIGAGVSVKIHNTSMGDEGWYGYSIVKSGVSVSIGTDGSGNIVFNQAGAYDFYLDVTDAANPQLWIAGKACEHVDEDLDDICDLCGKAMPNNETVTVYYHNGNGWSNVYAYVWSDSGNNSWPGALMTAVDGHDGWFSIELTGYVNIIFNNGAGTQTADLVINYENPYYKGNAWITGFDGEVPEVIDNYVLKGIGEDWATGLAFEKNPDNENEWMLKGVAIAAGEDVKINNTATNGWYGYDILKEGITVELTAAKDGNVIFTNAGTYNFYLEVIDGNHALWIEESVETPDPECTEHVDEDSDNLCDKCGEAMPVDPTPDPDPECTEHVDEDEDGLCDKCGEAMPVDPTPDPEPVDNYFIKGVGEDWATGLAMSKNPSNDKEWMLTGVDITAGEDIKIHNPALDQWIGASAVKPEVTVVYTAADDGNIVFTYAGTYDFYLEINGDYVGLWIQAVTPEIPECTEHVDEDSDNLCDNCGAEIAPVDPTPDPEPVDNYFIKGVGEDWATGLAMSKNPSNDKEWMLTGVDITAGEDIKIHNPALDQWIGASAVKPEVTVVYTAADDGNIVFTYAGTYDFYLEINGDYIGLWIQAVTPEIPECTEHVDEDSDNLCDNCGAEIAPVDPTPDPEPDPDPECTEHVDEDLDNLCDKCGEAMPVDPTPDPDPECTEHVDEDLDNLCDKCGEAMPVDPTPDPEPVDGYFLKGIDGDWAVGIQLSLNEGADEGKVEYMLQQVSIAAGTSVKINNPALELWVGAANVKDGVTVEYEADADSNILFLVEGKYDFYLDVTDVANPQLWIAAYVCPHVDEDLDGICDDCLAEIPQVNLITVYYYNAKAWSTVNAYAWNDVANNSWPGVAMTAVEGHDGWFSVELDGSFVNIIFNNNGAGAQTADLVIDLENPYYNGSEWVEGLDVEIPVIEDAYLIKGIGEDWTTGLAMTKNPDNEKEWMLTGVAIAAGEDIKINNPAADSWYGYEILKEGITVELSAAADGNIIFINEGTYDFYLAVDGDYVGLWIQAVTPEIPECTEHVDEDLDNLCDKCGAEVAHVDPTPDPEPDPDPECTEHVDEDLDNLCDKCGAEIAPVDPTPDPEPDPDPECTEHVDEDLDNLCDKCGAEIAPVDPTPDPEPVDNYFIKGVGEDWATGLAMSKNPSNDKEWMLTGVEIAAGEDIKIHNPALDQWIGASAVKPEVTVAYTAAGDGNIVFTDAGTYDFYLEINGDYVGLWIAAYVCPHVDEDLDGICDDCLAEIPQVNLITVYYYNAKAWSTVNAYAWNDVTNNSWPGVAMTAVEGHDGWFSVELDGSFVNIIFNNGAGAQTADLVINQENPYYKGNTWNAGFDVEVPEVGPITVYYYNENNWAQVNAYAWSGSSNNGWPGVAMTAVEGQEGWYSIELDSDYVNIIFNNGAGAQTADLIINIENPYYANGAWQNSFDLA